MHFYTDIYLQGTASILNSSGTNILEAKQDTLVSGVDIKTINGVSLLGGGNMIIGAGAWGGISGTIANQTDLQTCFNSKQATLISGTNIKTINGNSLVGSGDLVVSGGGSTMDGTTLCTTTNISSILPACNTKWNGKQDSLVSGTSIKTVNGNSLLGSGDIVISGGGGSLINFSESTCCIAGCLATESILSAVSTCLNANIVLKPKGCGGLRLTPINGDIGMSPYSIDLGFRTGVVSGTIGGGFATCYNTIVGGYENYMCTASFSSMYGGFCNTACLSTCMSGIFGGMCNKLLCSNYSTIIGGVGNCLSLAHGSVILGGCKNTIISGYGGSNRYGMLFGGCGQIGSNDSTTMFALANGTTAKANTDSNYNLIFCVSCTGVATMTGLKIPTNAALNKVLISDASGNATWGTVSATAVETLGTAIASAATTSLTVSTGNSVHITGTTTITSLGTTGTTGQTVKVIFDNALVLTHNATSLILLSGANITTAAGDTAVFLNENGALGRWRMLDYTRKSGKSLVANNETTARCLTHSVAGFSVDSVSCVISENCASLTNTVVACTDEYYTAKISNIACGFYAYNINELYTQQYSDSCFSFALKDIQNANANLGCFSIARNSVTFIDESGTNYDLLHPVAPSNSVKYSTTEDVDESTLLASTVGSAYKTLILCGGQYSTINNTVLHYYNYSCNSDTITPNTRCILIGSVPGYLQTMDAVYELAVNGYNQGGVFICSSANYANQWYKSNGVCNGMIEICSNSNNYSFTYLCSGTNDASIAYSCANVRIIAEAGKSCTCTTTASNTATSSVSIGAYLLGDSSTKFIEIELTVSKLTKLLKIYNLPTTNPGVSCAVWNNNGVLSISAG